MNRDHYRARIAAAIDGLSDAQPGDARRVQAYLVEQFRTLDAIPARAFDKIARAIFQAVRHDRALADKLADAVGLAPDSPLTHVRRKVTAEEVNALTLKTRDAYSFPAYASWRACVVFLFRRGHDAREVEAILRSKWTRWAADASKRPYGRATAADLGRWLDKHAPADDVRALTRETFETQQEAE